MLKPLKILKGYVQIGSISACKMRFISASAVPSFDFKEGSVHIAGDESGTMGPDQGDAYLIGATVVSDWELFGDAAILTKKGYFKKGHSATEEDYMKFYMDVKDLIRSIHIVAIRKDSFTPSREAQHNIHLGGLATIVENILRTEGADHIEATVDFSTQIQPLGMDRRLFEENPYGKKVQAETDNAKRNKALSSNDLVMFASKEWIAGGFCHLLQMFGTKLHYTVTDFKTMELIGGRVSLELNTGNTYRPIEYSDWNDIDLSKDELDPNVRVVGRTDDYANRKHKGMGVNGGRSIRSNHGNHDSGTVVRSREIHERPQTRSGCKTAKKSKGRPQMRGGPDRTGTSKGRR